MAFALTAVGVTILGIGANTCRTISPEPLALPALERSAAAFIHHGHSF